MAADREIVYSMTVNNDGLLKGTKAAQDAVQKLTEETQTLAEAITEVEDDIRNVSKASAESKAAENFEKLNKIVDENVLSIQELGTAADNYKNIALAAGKESPIGQQALQMAADLEKQMDETTRSVDALKEGGRGLSTALSLGSGVVAGYTAFESVTALVGVESEKLQETFVKLQAAQAALMSIQELKIALDKEGLLVTRAQAIGTKLLGAATASYNIIVGTSTGLMKAFKLALAATGIGLIIVGIGMLVANWEAFTSWVSKSVKALKDFALAMAEMIPFLGDYAKAQRLAAEAEAAAAAERARAHKALAEETAERIRLAEEEAKVKLKALDETIAALELEKDTLEAEGKTSDEVTIKILEAEKEKLVAVLEANKEKIASWTAYYEGLAAMSGKSTEDFKEEMKLRGVDLDNFQEQANDALADQENAVQFAENRITKFKREQGEKRAADAKTARDKMEADAKAAEEKMLALEKTLTDLRLENIENANQKEIQSLMEKHRRESEEMKKQFGENSDLEQELLIKHQGEMEVLFDKFDADRVAAEEAIIQERLKLMKDGADKELAIMKDKHRLEREELVAKFGTETDLLQELTARQEEELAEFNAEQDEIKKEEQMAKINENLEIANQALASMQEVAALIDQISAHRKKKIDEARDIELKDLDKQKKRELAREGLTAKQKIAIENKFALAEHKVKVASAKQKDKIAKREFNRTKALKLVEIGLNTAGGVMQALGSFPPPASFIFAGITATIGTVQAAIAAAQKFQPSSDSIPPPQLQSFSIPSGAAGGGGGGGGGAGGGGPLQDDTTTNLEDLEEDEKTSVTISQVEINENRDQMEKVKQVATI